MKKLYLLVMLIFLVKLAFSQAAPTTYCNTQPTQTDYADIENVTFGSIDNTSTCASLSGTQGTGIGTADLYTNFTNSNVPTPIITPGSSSSISVKIMDCTVNFLYCGQGKVWVDFNRDGTFQEPSEMFPLGGITCFSSGTDPTTYTTNIVAPSTLSEGYTRMRVSWRMYENNQAAVTPCGAGGLTNGSNWGETEDYIVLLGPKKWDYSMNSMLSPDSIAFCGQAPVIIKGGYIIQEINPL